MQNIDYGILTPLLPFLGACLYGDAPAFYGGLNESERAELEAQGKCFGLTAWFYRYLHEVLPEEKRAKCRRIYQARQAKAIMGAHELKRLYGVLASHGLRFVPIKGADMAYRLYPDTALRVFNDWDIWFHPDDCGRALEVLREDGWTIPERYSDEQEKAFKTAKHHFSPHVRGQYALEPHFTLANFEGIDPLEMWSETAVCPNGNGQRALSPEMNLLMLARHAASQSYYHAQLPKLLTDAAMLMQKETVDFAKLRSMTARWHLPYPGDLLAAFPEFFPSGIIMEFGADPRKTAGFRRVFELRGKMGEQKAIALLLGRFKAHGQVAGGLLNHIKTLNPGKIRCIYRLPKHGAWGRVAWSYVCYLSTRGWRMFTVFLRGDPDLRDYTSLVEGIESNPSEINE